VAAHIGFMALAPAYDPDIPGGEVGRQQRFGGGEIGWVGDYEAEFNFAGRLNRPVVELLGRDPIAWVRENPRRSVIVTYSRRKQLPGEWPLPTYVGAWRGRILAIWPAALLDKYGAELLSDSR